MIKVMSLIKRKEGMSLDAYRKWALEEHPKLARNIPGMKRYQVDVMLKDDPANRVRLVTKEHPQFGH
jgi:hypothetical protein